MNRTIFIVAAAVLLAGQSSFTQAGEAAGKNSPAVDWGDYKGADQPFISKDAHTLPLIRVQGNTFVNDQGTTILFRGISISDPHKIVEQGHWNKPLFEKLKEWGVMVVRIPVHPRSWRERTPVGYVALIDQAVEWCTELGMYVDIDWHSIGNLHTELFQAAMYNTSKRETFEFWRIIARRYQGNHTVAFYELFNEPTVNEGKLGPLSWAQWKAITEEMISLVKAHDPEKIPLVAGFNWGYDLTPLNFSPINAEGIAYVTHPYPSKRAKPYESQWEIDYGFAAGKYPVVATEIGFTNRRPSTSEDYGTEDYGKAVVSYLEGRGISWFAWVFDPEWGCNMIESWDTFKPTENGEFFGRALRGKITP